MSKPMNIPDFKAERIRAFTNGWESLQDRGGFMRNPNYPTHEREAIEDFILETIDLMASQMEAMVRDYAFWWSDKQTSQKDDWIKRESRSIASHTVTEYFNERAKELLGGSENE